MHRRELSAFLAVVIVLAGCRADRATKESQAIDSSPTPAPQSSAPPQQPPPPEPSNDPRPIIVCFGDSLTAGYGAEAGQSYPDYLQSDLDARGYHYRVINAGVSGNTTKDGVARITNILTLKPEIVIVEFGGNDGLRGLPIADTRANLDRIVAALKASGTKVALAGITLPPDYGPDYIHQFDETYTQIARKYNVPLLPFLLKGVFGVDGMMQPDNTHATAAGNQIVAQNVLPLVTPLIKKDATPHK